MTDWVDPDTEDAPKDPAAFDGWTAKPDAQNQPLPSASYPMPSVPSGGGGGTASTKVDSAALRTFADNLTPVLAAIDKGRIALKGLEVPAGAFAQAYQLRTNILGTGSSSAGSSFSTGVVPVIPGTKGFLDAAYDAAYKLQTNTRAMATVFESTEELNTAQAKKLEELMLDTGTSMGVATGAPTTPLPAAKP